MATQTQPRLWIRENAFTAACLATVLLLGPVGLLRGLPVVYGGAPLLLSWAYARREPAREAALAVSGWAALSFFYLLVAVSL
jgi:hypothetical protein